MDAAILSKAAGISTPRAQQWALPLSIAMDKYRIVTSKRQAAFIAQVGHESMGFARTREIWNPAQVPAQSGYEGRADLGNTQPGDGMRFMGRGLIQITGRANYQRASSALGVDFVKSPTLVERDDYAALVAGWFWDWRGLNAYADSDDFLELSARINGRNKATGRPNGWADRQARWERAKNALGVK